MSNLSPVNVETLIAYARAGYQLFPAIPDPDKGPGKFKPACQWKDAATSDEATLHAWHAQGYPVFGCKMGVEIAPGLKIAALDTDEKNGKSGSETLIGRGIILPANQFRYRTPNGGEHRFYVVPTGQHAPTDTGDSPNGIGPGVDRRGDGGYVWLWALNGYAATGAELLHAPEWFMQGARNSAAPVEQAGRVVMSDEHLRELSDRLAMSPERFDNYDAWIRLGAALHHQTEGSELGLELFDKISKVAPKYEGRREIESKWRSFGKGYAGPRATIRSYLAEHPDIARRAWFYEELRKPTPPIDPNTAAPPVQTRPHIYLNDHGLSQITRQMESALADDGRTYQRGNQIVQVLRAKTIGEEAPLRIDMMSAEQVLFRLSDIADFSRYGKPTKDNPNPAPVRTDPSVKHANSLCALKKWEQLPVLSGIASVPFMRADGSIVQTNGYDADTGIYLELSGTWPQVPGDIIAANALDVAKAALQTLFEPFAQFEWLDDVSKAVFLCEILQTLILEMLPTTPNIIIDAPTAGAGKSALADACSMICNDTVEVPTKQLPQDEAEIGKVLVTEVMAGTRVVVFDNIDHPINSAALNLFKTSTAFSGRILATNQNVTAPTRITLIYTGNQIELVGDMIRRSLVMRLVPSTENPASSGRVYKVGDIKTYLSDRMNRRRLAIAGLTALRAFHVAGKPQGSLKPLGSFEGWSSVVRACVVWAGWPDPLESQVRIRADDPLAKKRHDRLHALYQQFGNAPIRAADIFRYWGSNAALKEAFPSSDKFGNPPSADSIGRHLAKLKDQRADGMLFRVAKDSHEKTGVYQIEGVPASGIEPKLTEKAAGHTYRQFIAAGWTMDQMRQHGYLH